MPGFDPHVQVFDAVAEPSPDAQAKIMKIQQVFVGTRQFPVESDLDSGSTHTFWGAKEAEAFLRRGGPGRVIQLEYPFNVRIANRKLERCKTALITSLHIPYASDDKAVEQQDVMVYLVEADWAALLVGWDVLYKLGITPEQALQQRFAPPSSPLVPKTQKDGSPILTKEDSIAVLTQRLPAIVDAFAAQQISAADAEHKIDNLGDVWHTETTEATSSDEWTDLPDLQCSELPKPASPTDRKKSYTTCCTTALTEPHLLNAANGSSRCYVQLTKPFMSISPSRRVYGILAPFFPSSTVLLW